MNRDEGILFSGGAAGAEAEFGACAERHGIEEVNFTFEGHTIARHRGVRVLNHEELQSGDISHLRWKLKIACAEFPGCRVVAHRRQQWPGFDLAETHELIDFKKLDVISTRLGVGNDRVGRAEVNADDVPIHPKDLSWRRAIWL